MPKELPLFPNLLDPKIETIFSSLCTELAPDHVVELNNEIDVHLQRVRDALHMNEFIDVALAERMATALKLLLSEYAGYSSREQQLVVGAVRYFSHGQDAQADFSSILGFDDDLSVLNYVLKEIGRPDLKVSY